MLYCNMPLTKLSKIYWMTLLLPWPSRRMASHGSSSRVESWDISSGETTATSRRPPAGEERGGRRGKLGVLTQIATFATKMHLFFMKAVSKSSHTGLRNYPWIIGNEFPVDKNCFLLHQIEMKVAESHCSVWFHEHWNDGQSLFLEHTQTTPTMMNRKFRV